MQKWNFEIVNVQINNLAIIMEENVTICNWPLRRTEELFAVDDEIIRI